MRRWLNWTLDGFGVCGSPATFTFFFFFVTLDRVERLRLIELGLEVAFGFCILMIALLAWNPFVLRCGSAFCKYRHEFPGRENGGSR